MRNISFTLLFSLLVSFLPLQASAATVGDLVKCADFSAVYYLGEDGKRYVFPNEKIYLSWYDDFNSVKTISCTDLASLSIGGNVVYRPGSRLFKLQTVNSVYAVELNGTIRSIASEDQALALYGEDWASRIDDLSDAFWSAYSPSKELEDGELPEGFILQDDDSLYQIYEGEAIKIPSGGSDTTTLERFAQTFSEIEERNDLDLTIHESISLVDTLLAKVDIDEDDEVDPNNYTFTDQDEVEDIYYEGPVDDDGNVIEDEESDDEKVGGETSETTTVSSADCTNIFNEATGISIPDGYSCEITAYTIEAEAVQDIDGDFVLAEHSITIEDYEKTEYTADLYHIRYWSDAGAGLGLSTYYFHYWIMGDLIIEGTRSYYYDSRGESFFETINGPDGEGVYEHGDYEILDLTSTTDPTLTFDIEFHLSDAYGDGQLTFNGSYVYDSQDESSSETQTYAFHPSLYIRTSWMDGEHMSEESLETEDTAPNNTDSGSKTTTNTSSWNIWFVE